MSMSRGRISILIMRGRGVRGRRGILGGFLVCAGEDFGGLVCGRGGVGSETFLLLFY